MTTYAGPRRRGRQLTTASFIKYPHDRRGVERHFPRSFPFAVAPLLLGVHRVDQRGVQGELALGRVWEDVAGGLEGCEKAVAERLEALGWVVRCGV